MELPMTSTNKENIVWLGVYGHPDDETSASAGTMVKLSGEGHQVYVITATGGELGTLGTGGTKIRREDLASVRESELKANMKAYGANPPYMLRYVDQELEKEDSEVLAIKILDIMHLVEPDVVSTFGPSGISNHPDHIAIHKSTLIAYKKYFNPTGENSPLLIYPSIPEDIAEMYNLQLSAVEKNMDLTIGIDDTIGYKIEGLKNYKSQEDAQEFAAHLSERKGPHFESFAVSDSSPNDWESYPVVDYLRSL
jgi:LmbE family N-acetylglucosaminyl deacetylase